MEWPHAPVHWIFEPGVYMVTAGTYKKLPHLRSPSRLDFCLKTLFETAAEFRWELRAWAILSNHYHFIAASPADPTTLPKLLGKFHMQTSKEINRRDGIVGRKVWFQFWDSHITFETSYLARLNYIHYNPVHHGITTDAENYKWCSAAWFARNASRAFVKTVQNFKSNQLRVPDDF